MDDPFEAAGPLRDAYRQVDWASTPLGPISSWSPALRAAVSLVVRSKIGATLLWGPAFVLLYNEAYIPILAEKHPAALGRTAQEVFPEVWPDIGPLLQSVSAGAGTVGIEDFRLLIRRHHQLQESYFTFSYSAVAGDDGTIEGVLDVVAETTAQVIAHRRLAMLSRLISRLADVNSPQELLDRALPVLRAASDDLDAVDLRIPDAVPPADRDTLGTGDDRTVRVRLAADKPAHDGTLLVRLSKHLLFDDAYQEFVTLVAGTLEQSLNRVHARQNERRDASLQREMSEALQRSLLTEPVQTDQLRVAVRYQPAAEQVQVGGDWYDSFRLPDGGLTVVIGDVSGHDRHSAAAMAQIRNLTRGIAYTLGESPARVLHAVDTAMSGLAVDALATAVLLQIDQPAVPGPHTLRWSNAGHPPPLLLHPDGTADILHTSPEVLLGTRGRPGRHDHTTVLEPGSSVILYTDGLIERRGATLDDGIAELTTLLTGRQEHHAEQICDLVLAHFGPITEDDTVLTVIHVEAVANATDPEDLLSTP